MTKFQQQFNEKGGNLKRYYDMLTTMMKADFQGVNYEEMTKEDFAVLVHLKHLEVEESQKAIRLLKGSSSGVKPNGIIDSLMKN